MKRRGPALFELINGGGVGRRVAPVRIEPRVDPAPERPVEVRAPAPEPVDAHEPTPASEPVARAGPVRAAARVESSEPGWPKWLDLQRRFHVSLSAALLAGMGVIALCVLVWSVAFDVGRNEAEEAARRDLRLQAGGGIRDPLNTDLPLNPGLVRPETRPSPPPTSASNPPTPPAAAVGDPREVGKNYLQLVTTDRAEAEALVQFLGENGVPAFMLPLDGTGGAANNRARFTVFCSRGITGDEFRARAPARTELDEAIGRLGRVWRNERRGSTDFSGRIWSKYSR